MTLTSGTAATSPDIELLRKVWLFDACTRRDLLRISRLARECRVPSGTVLVREGEPSDSFMVVAEGLACVTVGGREIASVGPGAFLGEVGLLDHQPRTATVTTTLPSRLLVFDAPAFEAVLQEVPLVVRAMLQVMATRLRRTDALDAAS